MEEGATLGTKIGVGVAQGGDLNEVAAGEIANSASKLAVGPVGTAGLGRVVDGVTDKIPIKGQVRPAPVVPNVPAAQPPAPVVPPPPPRPVPVEPADVPLPPSPTRPVPPPLAPTRPAPVDPANVPLPDSPTRPAPATPVDPANVPLPPSPTTTGRPAVPPINTSDAQANTGTASPSDGFVTAPTSPTSPTPSDGFATAPTSPTDGADTGGNAN
ncbi:hypothetical protein [Streptomyces prunicolor]|uniref:hypothetical protein n=1 Tax=Streptomyces prunicolor TaxID=67348 RepID=UPI0033E11EA4